MNADFARFIADQNYRRSFLDGLDRAITTLKDSGHYQEMACYCRLRELFEDYLKRLRL